jgi:hypothetical protein
MRRSFKIILCLSLLVGFYGENVRCDEGPLQTSALGVYVSLAGNATGTMGPGVGILLSWKERPLLGLTWSLLDRKQTLGAFGDWRVADGSIEQTPLRYYLGGGGYGGITFNEGDVDVALGARVPAGLSFLPARHWELFFQLVPMLEVLPELGLRLGADLGFKYRF